MTVTPSTNSPPAVPDAGQETAARPAAGRAPWRAAGTVLASIGPPVGIGIAAPLLGQVVAAIELAAVLTIIGTALFGSQALSERAFRLLRWIANRPEPPAPSAPPTVLISLPAAPHPESARLASAAGSGENLTRRWQRR